MALKTLLAVSSVRSLAGFPGTANSGVKTRVSLAEKVRAGIQQVLGIVLKTTDPRIAVAAQKPANFAGLMIVVDMKPLGPLTIAGVDVAANGAPTVLLGKHCVVLSDRHPVEGLKIAARLEIRVASVLGGLVFTGALRRVTGALRRIEAIAALPVTIFLASRRASWEIVERFFLLAFGAFVHAPIYQRDTALGS